MTKINAQNKFIKQFHGYEFEYDFKTRRISKVIRLKDTKDIEPGEKQHPIISYYTYFDNYLIRTYNFTSSRDSIVLNSNGLICAFYSNNILRNTILYDSLEQGIVRSISKEYNVSYYYDSEGGLKGFCCRHSYDGRINEYSVIYKTARTRHFSCHNQLSFPYSVFSFEGTYFYAPRTEWCSTYNISESLHLDDSDEGLAYYDVYTYRGNTLKTISDCFGAGHTYKLRFEDLNTVLKNKCRDKPTKTKEEIIFW